MVTTSTQQHNLKGPASHGIPCGCGSLLLEPLSAPKALSIPQAFAVFNVFICSTIKPSVAVTGQNVDDKNKRMFMERFHEKLTRRMRAAQWCLVADDQGNSAGLASQCICF